jgi:hypothetical protein
LNFFFVSTRGILTVIFVAGMVCGGCSIEARAQSSAIFDEVSVSVASTQKVGARRAGIACFPNGSLRSGDFVGGSRDLKSALEDAIDRLVGGNKPRGIRVSLSAIQARLCARSWGLGDRRNYSGSAHFSFLWSAPSVKERAEEISMDLPKAEAREPEAIFQIAVDVLVSRILFQFGPGGNSSGPRRGSSTSGS